MPQLLMFAPCERIIVEQGANSISLISVLQEVTVTPPASGLASDAVAATVWYVLAMWQREDGEAVKPLKQRVTVEDPTGKTAIETFTDFDLTKGSHRNIGMIQGLPVGVAGRYTLRLALQAEDGAWKELATYPLAVKHSPAT